jgi:hypothetical protein
MAKALCGAGGNEGNHRLILPSDSGIQQELLNVANAPWRALPKTKAVA